MPSSASRSLLIANRHQSGSLAQEAGTLQDGGPVLEVPRVKDHREVPDQDTAHPEGTALGRIGTGPEMRPGQPANLVGAPCS